MASLFSCCVQDNRFGDVEVAGASTSLADLLEVSSAGEEVAVQKLLAAGADANACDPVSTPRSRGATALIRAARSGHAAVVNVLLQADGINANATTTDEVAKPRSGQTALHWAAREGHVSVVQQLVACDAVDPNPQTQIGFTPIMIAAQSGHLEVVKVFAACDRTNLRHSLITPHSNVELNVLKVSIFEGQEEIVKALLSTGREDGPELNAMSRSQEASNTPVNLCAVTGNPNLMRILLEAKGDPDIRDDRGRSGLQLAVDADNVEIVMQLLTYGAASGDCFSDFRQAQILGNAKMLSTLYSDAVMEREQMPALHKATLQRTMPDLKSELERLESTNVAAGDVVDGGPFPAAYWAIELGDWDIVKELLIRAHDMPVNFVEKLLSGGFGVISSAGSEVPGERVFEVFRALLADDAAVLLDHKKAKGAFRLLKPFCGSVTALQYFQKMPAAFQWLLEKCLWWNRHIYDIIDKEVGTGTLAKLAKIGDDENKDSVRQDDGTLLPELLYFINESKGIKVGGNHELYATRSLALAALAVNELFAADLKALLNPSAMSVVIHEAPPKTYGRMFNKLVNKHEHGDPSIPKPRPMKNIDVIRMGISVDTADEVVSVFNAIKSKYRILRVKNTHDPSLLGFGGYRSVLVNFAYGSGLTVGEVFGKSEGYKKDDREDFKPIDGHQPGDATSHMWYDYCMQMKPSSDWLWGLEGLWRADRHEPDRQLLISGEVQIILKNYMQGRTLSHLLYKISRCETGPSEMARDFATSFVEETAELRQFREAVIKHAKQLRDRKG